MSQFQKPENALKRAEELIEVGNKKNALDVLKEALNHRKWRNNWTQTIEQIVIKHLELCVDLKKIHYAKDGLHQYRGTCQAANIGSLEFVVQSFRKAAEEKVSEAKKQQEDSDMQKMEDLDEGELPQTILLRSIQAHDTRTQSQDREVTAPFRFLLETYRIILDVLKSNVRLEEVYHETAQHAFEFCRANKRALEFKRLSELLRKNYQDLAKPRTPNQHQVNPSNADTILRTIDTRFAQLRTATELDLWREAYTTATEIYELMNKGPKIKPPTRFEYYKYLGEIFWRSDNYLFHAFACMKNVMFVKAVKRDLSKEELQTMASKAVMAALCVPFQRNSDIHTTLEMTTEGQSSPYEKAKKHAHLFSAQSVPTRDSIISTLIEKNLLQHAAEPCQRLFALIESDFTPLSLCQDAKPFLDEIAGEDVCEGKLHMYITPVKKIIFFRLMKQLSEVYANMTIENFERAASIVPFSIAEKWMANAARQQGINIQINYREKAIVFGAPRKVDLKSMRQPLIEIGHKLQQAMQRVAPEEQNKKEKIEKQALHQNIVKRIEEERVLIWQRKEEIERRKEENERKKQEQEREAAEKISKQQEKEAEAERKRLQEERNKREAEREEQKRKDAKMKETKEMLEQMKKQDESKPSNLKIAGKKIGDIQAEDIEKFSIDELERARQTQVQRERQEKIRQRKLESKRVDHLSRAIREEEKAKLPDFRETVYRTDNAFLEQVQKDDVEDQKRKHEEGLIEKRTLEVFQAPKDEYVQKDLAKRVTQHETRVDQALTKSRNKAAEQKIERARKRKAANDAAELKKIEEAKRAEEDRRRAAQEAKRRAVEEQEAAERREQEEKEQAEEQARKAKEREAREAKRKEMDEMRERAEAKRREKELEIERRMTEGGGRKDEDRDAGRDAGRGAWGRGTGRDAGRDDDKDSWRRNDSARDGGRGGGDDSWRRNDRRDDDREEKGESKAPWRRSSTTSKADEEDGWRKPAYSAPRGGGRDRDGGEEEQPWRRGGGGGQRDAADEDNSWSKRASARRDPEPADDQADDDDFQTVRGGKKGKASAPEPVAEAAPADDDDDDGFTAVTAGKKKKKAEPAGGAPPWRRSADNDDDKPRPTREDWKKRGEEPSNSTAGAASRPWRK